HSGDTACPGVSVDANVVNIVGGLGNQLFQYFFGVCLERGSGQRTLYDLSDFSSYALHEGFTLERYFDVKLASSNEEGVRVPLTARSYSLKRLCWRSRMLARVCRVETDATFTLAASHRRVPSSYFFGYWQS